VKIWFQNRRSKFKKLVKRHDVAGDLLLPALPGTAGHLLPSPGSLPGGEVCHTPPSSSSFSSPAAPSPPETKAAAAVAFQKQTVAALRPEAETTTTATTTIDRFSSDNRFSGGTNDSRGPVVFPQPAPPPAIGDWTSAVGSWRTDGFDASPAYAPWPAAYGLHPSAAGGGGMSQHVGGVWSADEQWSTAASGFDRRYRGGSGGGLVGVPSWYAAAAAANTRHTSPPV